MNRSVLIKAIDIAYSAHSGQCRNDGYTPYITHPLDVLRRYHMCTIGIISDDYYQIAAAAVCHDVLEDCIDYKIHPEKIIDPLGDYVYEMCLALVNESKKPEHERKSRKERKQIDREFLAKQPSEIQTIKALDRSSNLDDLSVLKDSGNAVEFAVKYLYESMDLCAVLTKASDPSITMLRNTIINAARHISQATNRDIRTISEELWS